MVGTARCAVRSSQRDDPALKFVNQPDRQALFDDASVGQLGKNVPCGIIRQTSGHSRLDGLLPAFGGGDCKSRLDTGRNCWSVALIFAVDYTSPACLRSRLLGDMREVLKQLFVKDSELNRRISQSIRAACLRDGTILVCGIVILALALFAWCALRFGFSFDFWFIPFFYALIFAPTFVVLAAMDILRRGWTLKRVFALLCSAVAVALVAALMYVRIHINASPKAG
jgi:hypothetical protein